MVARVGTKASPGEDLENLPAGNRRPVSCLGSAWRSGLLNNSTEVHPSDRTNQTNQAVYRIDPRTSGMDFWFEPQPDDRTDRTRARLSRPSRHSKDNSRAMHSLDREESKDGHAFSPSGPSRLSRVRPSPYRRAPIWWLSLDCGYIKSHSAALDDPFNPFKFQKCHLPSRIISLRQANPNRRCRKKFKPSRTEAEQRRLFSQFEVREFCDNLVEGVMKALKDVSKKSTTTCAPVAEPSLFISEKSKGKSENNLEDLKDFSDYLPIFYEYDEELIESLMICEAKCDLSSPESEVMFDNEKINAELTFLQPEHPSSLSLFSQDFVEEPFDYQHQGPLLGTRRPIDLGPIFDEENEPGPIFDETAPSITSIIMESRLCFDPGTTHVPLSPNPQEHQFDQDRHVLEMFYDISCLGNILIYNTFFAKHDEPWISNSQFELDLVQPLKSERIDCAHQPEIWRCMYARDGDDHGRRRDDKKSSPPEKLLEQSSSNEPKVNHDQILNRASRGGRHNTCVPGTWNWNKMDLRSINFQEGGNDAPLGSAPGKTDMRGLIMGSSKDKCSLFDSYLPNNEASTHEITLENVLNSIMELLEEESDQTEFICDSYAIYKSDSSLDLYNLTLLVSWCASYQATDRNPSFVGLVHHIKQQLKSGSIKRLSAPLVTPFNPSVIRFWRVHILKLMAQALTSSLVDEPMSYSKLNKELDTTMQLMRTTPASRFMPPTSGVLPQGQGLASSFRLPGRAISPALELNGNLP
ncbi:hypothetical protein F2Q69_00023119 [Brassica cretica]|uniref:Uncharacterized protein n=1 Tax=Brassica cretica TaxID=69181 RepID=A0A8S9QNQ8_BRACR|nr:hypothetical protein F2Q69_00023119 [Brassica cretica]